MTPESRLAGIVTALERVGVACLVMGGHAVRYYGLARNTDDYDLHLAPDGWDDLPARLAQAGLVAGPLVEGPSWRPNDFRRFLLGRRPDGREEWLEFWRANHLLPPFAELYPRRETGEYGGRPLPFLGLPDLIRSKETERDGDWRDVTALEEFLDARLLASSATPEDVIDAVSRLRSRRGFESHLQAGSLADPAVPRAALSRARLSITQAFLLPFAVDADLTGATIIEPVIVERLRTVTPGSSLHLLLVEAVRRQYKSVAQAADRSDKESVRAAQANPPKR